MPPVATAKRPSSRASNRTLSTGTQPAADRRQPARRGPRRVPASTADLAAIRAASGLSQEDLSRLTGYSLRAVAGWEAGRPLARAARRRVAEIGRLLKALAELMPAGRVGRWLAEPNEAFEGQTPMHLVERGEADRLWEMIHQVDANVAN